MLKSWSIENFKPIVNSGKIKLAPVTVLAGMNSSGKSSFLQSILMISQTLSSRVLDRPLLPNGPIVQLGTFENIRNEKSGSRVLTIGFELETERKSGEILTKENLIHATTTEPEITKVIARFTSVTEKIASSAIEAAQISVESILLEIGDLATIDQETSFFPRSDYAFSINKLTSTQLKTFLKDVSPEFLSQIPDAEDDANYLGKIEINVDGKVLSKQYLVKLSHFLPANLFQKFAEEERRKRILQRNIFVFMHLLLDQPFSFVNSKNYKNDIIALNLRYPIPDTLKNELEDFHKKSGAKLPFRGETFLDVADWLANLQKKQGDRFIIRHAEPVFQQSLEEALYQINAELKPKEDRYSEGLEVAYNIPDNRNLYLTVEQITRFFTSKIRYLGPLRADPQASQKFAPSSELDEVGAKGEYAAAVYDANQNARIEWCNPHSMQVEQGTLKIALDSWTQYLGVANQIKIETAGQSGFSWQVVHKKDQKPLPLAAVGVGVSQVLPILVMGLLAPKNTLLIIEQPELHLHPRVQARLGDFFVGLSRCQKQCLIETHSENLVNQLRYHIVEAGGQEKSDCIIYFVDQDEQGATKFEPVEISPKGNILNWPEGFFDETMHQEDIIAAASIRKRSKIAQDG